MSLGSGLGGDEAAVDQETPGTDLLGQFEPTAQPKHKTPTARGDRAEPKRHLGFVGEV